jgi:hypothetical protein
VPTRPRPTRADIFGSLRVDYTLFLNALGLVIFPALFWLTARRRPADAGMRPERVHAH